MPPPSAGSGQRHRAAWWSASLSSSPPSVAPGTAALALRNARLGHTPRWCTTLPRPRVSAPKRTARHSGHAFRKLQAQPQSRFVVHNRLQLTTARCAGHCRARARQCPANPKRALPHKPRSASAAATSSDADTLRATAWSSGHGLRPPLCFQQSGFTQSALRVCQSERWSASPKVTPRFASC